MEGRDLVRTRPTTTSTPKIPVFVKEVGMSRTPPRSSGEEGATLTPVQQATEIPRGNSLYVTPISTGCTSGG